MLGGSLDSVRERAQSDIIGTTLLIGVVVVLVTLVGTLVLLGGSGDGENDKPLTDVNVSVTATTVSVTHEGGDRLSRTDIRVVIQPKRGDAEVLQGTGNDAFAVGDTLQWNHGLAGQAVTVRVIDTSTSTVITEQWFDVPTTSGGLRAAFTYGPVSPDTSDSVTFDATPSANPGSEISSYEWVFGDGATASGLTASHSYDDDGTYDVVLTATGPKGDTETATKSVTVRNVEPMLSTSVSPKDPVPGEEVTFSATASDSDGAVTSYEWNFGDGTTATGQTTTHSYDTAGSYSATVTVTDDDGATNAASETLTVNAPPTASFTVSPDSPTTQNVDFDASGSGDLDGSIVSYEWDLGDGTTASGKTVTPTYDDDGTYTVVLMVTDDDGATTTTTTDVTVANVAPTADYTAFLDDSDGDGVDEIVYDASASSEPDGTIETYRWTIGGGFVVCESEQPVCVTDQGLTGYDTTDVTLEVTDDDGATDSVTKADQPYPTPGFEVFGVVVAVLLGGWLRRRDYL